LLNNQEQLVKIWEAYLPQVKAIWITHTKQANVFRIFLHRKTFIIIFIRRILNNNYILFF
jgi:hypothetical protein